MQSQNNDRRIQLASAAWGRAKASDDDARRDRWTAAAMAYVCNHDALAKSLLITTVAVGQMASGYGVFFMLHKMDGAYSRRLRRKHTYTRFLEIGKLWAKYKFDIELLFEYIDNEQSIESICAEITNQHDPRPAWKRQAARDLPRLWHYVNDFDKPPQEVIEAAQNFATVLERYVG